MHSHGIFFVRKKRITRAEEQRQKRQKRQNTYCSSKRKADPELGASVTGTCFRKTVQQTLRTCTDRTTRTSCSSAPATRPATTPVNNVSHVSHGSDGSDGNASESGFTCRHSVTSCSVPLLFLFFLFFGRRLLFLSFVPFVSHIK